MNRTVTVAVLMIATLAVSATPRPLHSQQEKPDVASEQVDKDILIRQLEEQNRKLRLQLRMLSEQNALLQENLMNCIEELGTGEESEKK